jgi:hypothetical protein
MHGPWRANPKGSLQVAGKQSASLLGTPPRGIGNQLERKGHPHQSANEAAKMRSSASESEENCVVVKSEQPDDRRTFPTSARNYGRYEEKCKEGGTGEIAEAEGGSCAPRALL